MASLRILYSDTSQSLQSKSANPAVECSKPDNEKGGCQETCISTAETSGNSTGSHGLEKWIASQRGSLVRIFHAQAKVQGLTESEADLSGKCSGQSIQSNPLLSSSKTRPVSAPGDGRKLQQLWWREDIAGETESLPRLMSVLPIKGTDGGSLLPTLTVSGNWNRKGASKTSGDGLATAMRRLPTVCASDFRGPCSAEYYRISMQERSRPLRDTLPHTLGHRLTPAFAEWWMGWPINWTLFSEAAKETASQQRATARSRFKPQQRG